MMVAAFISAMAMVAPPVASASGAEATAAAGPAIHGLFQFQYEGLARSDNSVPVESGASLRRARLSIDALSLYGRFDFTATLSADQGALAPLDLYVDIHASPHWVVRLGQTRVPFSRSWLILERDLLFTERSIATEAFRYDYDIGALVMAQWWEHRIQAMAGAFNGAGKNVAGNDNIDPMLVVRVDGVPIGSAQGLDEADWSRTPLPTLSLGASATLDYVPLPGAYGFASGLPIAPTQITVTDADADGRRDGVRVFEAEADVDFRWHGVAVQGEGYLRREKWWDSGAAQPPGSQFIPNQRFGGAVAQVSYAFWRIPATLGGRFSYAALSPLAIGGSAYPTQTCVNGVGMTFPCALPYADRRQELTFVGAYAPVRLAASPAAIRLSAMYSFLTWRSSTGVPLPMQRDQRFILLAQLAF